MPSAKQTTADALRDLDRVRQRAGRVGQRVLPPQTPSKLLHPSTKTRARKGDKTFVFVREVELMWEMKLTGQSREDYEVYLLSLRREANRIWGDADSITLEDAFQQEEEWDGREDVAQATLVGRPVDEVSEDDLREWVDAASEHVARTERAIVRVEQELSRRKMDR